MDSALLLLPYLKSDIDLGSLVPDVDNPHQDAFAPPFALLENNRYSKRIHQDFSSFVETRMVGTVRSYFSRLKSSSKARDTNTKAMFADFHGWTYELKKPKDLFKEFCGISAVRDWLEEGIEDGQDTFVIIGFHTLSERAESTTTSVAPNDQPGERVYAFCYRQVKFKFFGRDKANSAFLIPKNRWIMTSEIRSSTRTDPEVVEADLEDEYGNGDSFQGDDDAGVALFSP